MFVCTGNGPTNYVGFIVERGKKLFINVLFLGRYHGEIFFPKSLIYDFGRKWGILRVRL